MEVRGGERLAYLALLFSVFCAHLTLGKYVKGIVDTKEVSILFTVIILGSFKLVATVAAAHRRQRNGHAGVSVADRVKDILVSLSSSLGYLHSAIRKVFAPNLP